MLIVVRRTLNPWLHQRRLGLQEQLNRLRPRIPLVARNSQSGLQQAEISQKQAQAALEATLKTIREALQRGNEVRLVGFGSFKVRQSAARKGVNPRDRKPIEVPAKERVRFFPGKELAHAVLKK